LGNSLIGPTLTIIGKFYEGKWVQEEGKAFVLRRRTQIVIDVQVVMPINLEKEEGRSNCHHGGGTP
jgi:hypothetical protein